jgi:uncharacterized membrane protein YphA (DoxX/SURF4 family)/thiol-disulfide isomerase/thioredoxin
MDAVLLAARLLLAGVFLVSGVAKLFDRDAVQAAAVRLGVPDRVSATVAVLLAPVEIALAVGLVVPRAASAAAWTAAALLLVFVVLVARPVLTGQEVECHCFGALNRSPTGAWALARNVVLLAVAVLVVRGAPAADDPNPLRWLADEDRLTLGLVVAVALLAVLGAALGLLALLLLRRNGELLLLLDLPDDASADRHAHDKPVTSGLPVGAPAPDFRLLGLHDEEITLQSVLAPGRPAVLTFTDPGCGPCRELLPDLARWHADPAAGLTFLAISGGRPDSIRTWRQEHPLSRVAVDRDKGLLARYHAPGTPSAVLITADGRIGGRGAAGAPSVLVGVAAATSTASVAAMPVSAMPVAAMPVAHVAD